MAALAAATAPTAEAEKPPAPRVVSRTVVWPRARTVHRRFRPHAQPSVARVHKIIAHESRKWGASEGYVRSIIWCESRYDWDAVNGQYEGLGQFAEETFRRGMRNLPSRRVRVREHNPRVRRHARLVTRYSDGKIKKKTLRRTRKIGRTTIRKGTIPRYPVRTHGWAQVRIVAAVVGGHVHSPSLSEWACAG